MLGLGLGLVTLTLTLTLTLMYIGRKVDHTSSSVQSTKRVSAQPPGLKPGLTWVRVKGQGLGARGSGLGLGLGDRG